MTTHEAKARSIVEQHVSKISHMGATFDDADDGLGPAIAEALREAEAEHEKQIAGLVAQHAANRREYMDICEDLSRKLEEARKRIAELEERLEIDHCYVFPKDGSEELVRQELPPERRKTFPDGITGRDATIRLLEENNAAKDARIAELEAALKKLTDLINLREWTLQGTPEEILRAFRHASHALEGKSDA